MSNPSSYSNNYGLNNAYEYYEYVFDSALAQRSFDMMNTKENWPMFFIGGKKPLSNVAAVKILEVQIPFSFYIITAADGINPGSGYFQYSDGLGSTNVTIPAGNYTTTSLATALQTALSAAHQSLGGAAGSFTVTYSQSTGKFSILGVDGGPIVYTLTFPAGSCYINLGMIQGANTSTGAGVLISPNVANVTGPEYLYLNSDTIGTLVNLFLPTTEASPGGNAGPQMAKIPVTTNPGGVIYWQDPDPQKWFDVQGITTLQQIDFYLTLGTSSKKLLLNGLSFSLKMGVLLPNDSAGDMSRIQGMAMKRIRQF